MSIFRYTYGSAADQDKASHTPTGTISCRIAHRQLECLPPEDEFIVTGKSGLVSFKIAATSTQQEAMEVVRRVFGSHTISPVDAEGSFTITLD
jgi:hypothetical protein